jgi:hypothetical protein
VDLVRQLEQDLLAIQETYQLTRGYEERVMVRATYVKTWLQWRAAKGLT